MLADALALWPTLFGEVDRLGHGFVLGQSKISGTLRYDLKPRNGYQGTSGWSFTGPFPFDPAGQGGASEGARKKGVQLGPKCRFSSSMEIRLSEAVSFSIRAQPTRWPTRCIPDCLFSLHLRCFSRKHGEGFFRWVHLSCSHESHCKESLQGIIIMKVIARSHCKESSS